MADIKFRSGFVAILGRPNVGKSSIMNRIVGEKVAIVSNHPQTTRNKLLGVATGNGWQIVFVDTPGLHKPRTKLGEYMMKSADEAREGVDAVLAVVDGQRIGGTATILPFTPGTGWVKYGDFYYYTLPVAPNAAPETALIGTKGIELVQYTDADGGKQVIEVMAEAIQSQPERAVGQAWGVTITEGKVEPYTSGN